MSYTIETIKEAFEEADRIGIPQIIKDGSVVRMVVHPTKGIVAECDETYRDPETCPKCRGEDVEQTVARIVAWLRAPQQDGISHLHTAVLAEIADAIEKGEWKL